jgi:hypothetical protein
MSQTTTINNVKIIKFHLRPKKSKTKVCITKLFLFLLNTINNSKAIISMELVVETLKT